VSWRFVTPPGWPQPPPGWVPPTGWTPDPSWPPPPYGWNFWVETPDGPVPAADPVPAVPPEAPAAAASGAPRGTSDPAAAVPPRSWRQRRRDRRKAEAVAAAAAQARSHWRSEQDLLDRLAAAAVAARDGGGPAVSGLVLHRGEQALWSGEVTLVEPRRSPGHYQGGSKGSASPSGTASATGWGPPGGTTPRAPRSRPRWTGAAWW
jgi:hypothetical protein